MIKGEGNDMGKAKDVGVIGQGCGCHRPRKGKDEKGKPMNNNAKCKNGLGQKEALQVGCHVVCPQKKE